MSEFWICFVPLFVAVDAIGIVPLFVALTQDMDPIRLRKVIIQSVITAALVALLFIFAGPAVLSFLGITVADFMIAGGLLLLVISFSDLLSGEKRQRRVDPESLGAVPLGVPLISGPAVLTTCLLLANSHGKLLTAAVAILNILIAGLLFWFSRPVTNLLGRTGSKTISKVASLLLVAIAVMLMRRGLTEAIQNAQP